MLVNMSTSTLDEYYPAIAIATLMRIIRDPALSRHHLMVVQVRFIFSEEYFNLILSNVINFLINN